MRNATDIARSLVTRYGMSEKVGPVAFGSQEEMVFLGKEFSTHAKNYSEEVAALIDKEVTGLMKSAYKRATEIIKKYQNVLDAIASKLIEKESLEREEFNSLIKSFGLKTKQAFV